MSARSKDSSSEVERPFGREILTRARQLVDQYQVILSQEEGVWYGHGVELPRTFGDGRTPAACIKATRQALVATVAYMLESGRTPPPPARDQRRTQQVNVRLTAEEQARIESTAKSRGYRGMSDYMRAAALHET